MLAHLVAAALHITVSPPPTGSIDQPMPLTVELVYPKDYKLLPGSLMQSLIQQESPLPSPFLIIDETPSPKSGKEEIHQHFTYTIQPLKPGKTTLLLQGQFENNKGDILTVYAPPASLEVSPATVEPPLLPPPYDPQRNLPAAEYTVRVAELKRRHSDEHADTIARAVEARQIPWWQILTALILGIAAIWFTIQKVISRQHVKHLIVTRYGLFRTLKQLATRPDTTAEKFFGTLEEQLKAYFHIPVSLTRTETIAYMKEKKLLSEERLDSLEKLLLLSEQSKFGPFPPSSDTYLTALNYTEETLK